MKIYLLGKDILEFIELPEKTNVNISVNKTFSGMDDLVLVIDGVDGHWYLKSTNRLQVVVGETYAAKVELVNYQYYVLRIVGTDKSLLLYSSPIKELRTYDLKLNGVDKILVGSTDACNIVYNQANFEIVKNNQNGIEFWQLNNLNQQGKVYINSVAYQTQILRVGDVVFANGLKLIWLGSFININNPNNLVHAPALIPYEKTIKNTDYKPTSDLENEVTLYQETDYFYHTLRMNKSNREQFVEIDPVPGSQEIEELPFLLTMGTSLTMGVSSMIMVYSLFDQLTTGKSTIIEQLPQMLMCAAMIIGCLIIPRETRKYTKRKAKKREALRRKKYSNYLLEKQKEISEIKKYQEELLKDNNPNAIECYKILTENEKIKNTHFWSRLITDNDFLYVRLGTGNALSNLSITAPEKHFTLDEDDLLEQAYKIADDAKVLENVPVTISLLSNSITGLIINNSYKQDYINNLVLQLATLHSATDLKIVVFTNEENERNWSYTKYLPHCWSDDKQTRFFATNQAEINEISTYLEEEYRKRKDMSNSRADEEVKKAEEKIYDKQNAYKNYDTYYIIINDDFNIAKNTAIVDILLKTSVNFGFSYLCIGDKIRDLPSKCNAFIELNEKTGTIINNKDKKSSGDDVDVIKFNSEYFSGLDMRYAANKMANIPTVTKDGLSVLPQSLNFMEMLKVSRVEQLNILSRWKNNNPVTSLSTTIGVHANGDDFKLDLHEKFHGPHGLIAGSTGSGKSEFIMTYILSMAVNYHPYEVQFVLIDYKGGGLAGAFENKETGVRIPHLIGTITNLDTAEMNRTLVSIESELKRRQKIFNEVKDKLDESTIDIYKYQRLYREGVVKEPMAHLFIISDEFAELKSQQPDFMQQLITTARIGRSLGVHLILATQKPSGVVNDQIWSNSKFKVCLKVQDRSDSMEMLKRPEAASIKESGRFYLQVGYDDYFDIGQSGWSGAKYVPTDRIIKKVDDSINFVNNVGYQVRNVKDFVKVDNTENLGEQLTNIVKYIYNLGQQEQIVTKKLWLDALSPVIYINNLKKKYNYKPTPYFINPIIGEYDNPGAQEQGLLNLDLTNKGNTLIYGQTGSGKELLLSTIVWSTMAEHTPDEVNMYIIDCGAETLKMFNNIPQVGEVATIEDQDLVYDIFDMLFKEMEYRKELFTEYAGSYTEYIANSGKKLPLIITVINNYEIFEENFSKLSDAVQGLYRDGIKYGIIFIISAVAVNAIRNRMAANFANILCLQLPNEGDYRDVVDAPRGLFPSKVFGRGLVHVEDTALEFQTAMFAQKKDMVNVVRQVANQLNSAYTTRARKIPVLPKVVDVEKFKATDFTFDKVPIGYNITDKEINYYNFNTNFTQILTMDMTREGLSFVRSTIELLASKENSNVSVVDFVDAFETTNDKIKVNKNEFDKAIISINNEIMGNKNNGQDYFYAFLGIGGIRRSLSTNGLAVLDNLFNNLSEIVNCHIILIDTYDSYKNLQIETWYQNINNMNGIWLGDEAENQLAINMPKLSIDDKNQNFQYMAFSVNNGKHEIIKHMVVVDEEEE